MVMVPSYKVFYKNCGNVGETQETFRQDDRERGAQHDVWGHGEGTQVIDFYLGHPTRWHCDNNDGDK